MRTRTLVVLAAGGLVLGAVGTAFVLTSDHEDNKGAFLSLALTVGLSFLVSGVLALWRRPENRTGALLIAVAYFWFLGGLTLSNDDWVFTLGVLVNSLALGAFVHLLLGFPSGRLLGRRDVLLVIGTYALVFVGSLAQLLVEERPDATSCPDCKSMIAVTDSDTASTVVRPDRRRAGARARRRDPRHRRDPLPAGSRRPPARARPRARHRRARDARPLAPARRRRLLGGRRGAALLRLPRHVRARAGCVPRRRPAQPARARRRRRRPPRTRAGNADPRRNRADAGRPDARDRVLAARIRPLRLGRRQAARRGDRRPCRDARRARGPADGRDPARSDAQGRAGAGRGGRRRGRPLARQRAPTGQAARPARVPRDDSRHVAVPALLARPRRPDREPEPRGHPRERLLGPGGGALAVVLGRVRRAGGARRLARPIRGGRALPHVGRLRAHLRESSGQGGHGRLVDCAALRRAGQRPQRDLRRARHHRAAPAGARAGGGARLRRNRREHDPDLPRRRLGRRDGERIRPEPGVRAPARLAAGRT